MAKKTSFLKPWLSESARLPLNPKGVTGRMILNTKGSMAPPADSLPWQKTKNTADTAVRLFDSTEGPVWVVSPFLKSKGQNKLKPDPWTESSPFAKVRDAVGQALQQAFRAGCDNLDVQLSGRAEDVEAALVGLEIASYKFRRAKEEKPMALRLRSVNANVLAEAERIGWCVNVARHLVNLPPNALSPKAFAAIARELAADLPSVKVEVWEGERLKKERMNLLLAVGGASEHPPCLVHLRYRPKGKSKPVALVGKGITFDSGGLDIKTAAGMRLMKKDMGGGAAVLAAFLWAAGSKARIGVDAYISLAENAVGSKAFRPGDVYTSRDGQTVEISNTDAEGRLVLADALNVAVTASGADEPVAIVDVATLTGAIKVGLGAALPGLFSNHAPLAKQLHAEFWRAGDPVWPMPLYQKYRSSMSSTVADMTNSVEAPFGGAVTAALFLENFVQQKSWAHLDIYAWKDGADGAWSESGGSGQAVLGLIRWLRSFKPTPTKS